MNVFELALRPPVLRMGLRPGDFPQTLPPPRQQSSVFIALEALAMPLPPDLDAGHLHLQSGAAESLAALAQAGYALLVVSHHGGLASGACTRAQVARLQHALEMGLRAAAGVELLDYIVCPHAARVGRISACLCHRPAPGLLLRGARSHALDVAQAWVVGANADDVEAGHRAGCRAALVGGLAAHSVESAPRRSPLREPDVYGVGWQEVAQHIVALSGAARHGADMVPAPNR